MFLVIGYIIVLLLIRKFGSKSPDVRKNRDYKPLVSIVIPTMNEEEVIEKRLLNILEMDYPKENLEVIFVDNSDDATPHIIERYRKNFPFIRLLNQQKPGFNNALNEGYSASKGEIVVKSDCTAFPRPDALKKVVSNFADSRIGAVCGVHVFPKGKKSIEEGFKNIEYKIQQVESYLHSSLISHGSFGAYKKNLVPRLREELTADDSELVMNVVREGYRAIVDPTIKCEEQAPETFRDRRKQKNRRAAGVIRVILSNLDMLFNKRYGAFGLIVVPMEFFILILSPMLVFLLFILMTYYALANPSIISTFILLFFGLVLISIKLSIRIRAIVDTYLSCFIGIFQAFTKKKKWR